MEFKSEYADSADDLIRLKNDAFSGVDERRLRLRVVRDFTNMQNTLTQEEAKELGISEITNHGQTHRAMSQLQSQFKSMVTSTNRLLDLVVDTDNPEVDQITSMRINEAINRGAIHYKGKFARFWDKVAGEFVIAGGGAVVQNRKYGWLPDLRPDMFFPSECSLDPEEVPYAFDPVELTVKDIEDLLASVKNDKGVTVDKAALKELLKRIKEATKDGTQTTTTYSHEVSHAVRDQSRKGKKIPAWWYYEIKYKEDGEQFVSATLVVDATSCIPHKKDLSSAYILAFYEKAYDSPTDFMHYPYVDSEIGGIKNMDTVKGVAEMQYPSALDVEELTNLIIQGEKIRARPKFRATEQGSYDDLLKWDVEKSSFAPPGIEEMVLKGTSNGLQVPLAILSQNAAAMANTGTNGNSGQLRVEALDTQRSNAIQQTNSISDAYNHLDSILEMVVWRILAGPIKVGTPGYQEIKWIREYLEKYDIDYKELSKRKYGRFIYLRVRATRTVGNGDRQQQLETADWMSENSVNLPPQNRPLALRSAWLLRTQDPDLVEQLVSVPQNIINSQKIVAENERDTIYERAALGQVLPTNADDIPQDHIPIHLMDMQAKVAKHALRPWDKLDVAEFAGMAMHCQLHINQLLENPATNGEAKAYQQDFQNIAQAGQKIASEVNEQEQSAQAQLDPEKQMKLQIELAQTQLKAQEIGLKTRQQDSIEAERDQKNQLAERKQLVGEINEDRKIELQKEQLDEQRKTRSKKSGSSSSD